MDNLWVLILVLVIAGAIVTIRLFRNGAREDAEPAALETLAPAKAPASPHTAASRPRAASRARAAPAAAASAGAGPAATAATATTPPTRATRSRRAASTPSPPAAWPGGDCPSCGSPTVPSAKFCGECGHRLVT